METYKDIFCFITKDGEEDGPYCIPCYTEGQLNRLIKMEEEHWWECEGCKRQTKEGEKLEEPQ